MIFLLPTFWRFEICVYHENCLKSALFSNLVGNWIEVACTETFLVHESLNVRDDFYDSEFLRSSIRVHWLHVSQDFQSKKTLMQAHHFVSLLFEIIIFLFSGYSKSKYGCFYKCIICFEKFWKRLENMFQVFGQNLKNFHQVFQAQIFLRLFVNFKRKFIFTSRKFGRIQKHEFWSWLNILATYTFLDSKILLFCK